MPIRKSNDIANDPNVNSRLKGSVQVSEILERFNVTKVNNILPGDEAFGYLSEKADQCIDTINANETAVSSSGTVEKAKILNTTRTIGGVSFNGGANIDLPGVNESGTQNTSGVAATATILATARTIGGVSFNGSANIVPKQHKGSISDYYLTPGDFYPVGSRGQGSLMPGTTPSAVVSSQAGTYTAFITLPLGSAPRTVIVYGSDTRNVVRVYMSKFNTTTTTPLTSAAGFAVGSTGLLSLAVSNWDSAGWYLAISVTTDGADSIYGGLITMR